MSLWEMEWRWRIPRKTNDKGWKELEAKIAAEATEWLPLRAKVGTAKVASIERQIGMLELAKGNKKKEKIKRLKAEQRTVEKAYLGGERMVKVARD